MAKRKVQVTKARAQKALRELVAIINCSDTNDYATAFRDIVTALRGPDSDDWNVKMYTTAVIRRDIGLNETSRLIVAPLGVTLILEKNQYSNHFADHICRAVAGLQLLEVKK